MELIEHKKKRVQAVIFDWAGTIVDFGSFAPVDAFMELFKTKKINVMAEEIRIYMGMHKKNQLRKILELDRINNQWCELYGDKPSESDIDSLYEQFEPILMNLLPKYSKPVPGAVELIESLKKRGIKIGTNTGYPAKMMEIVVPEAKKYGIDVDVVMTADDLPAGRPAPYMAYKIATELEIYPFETIIKVGDAVSDIGEGINAGMWTVGVVKGGSELGLTEEEIGSLDTKELEEKCKKVQEKLISLGAHFTIDEINDVEKLIEKVNERLEKGEQPHQMTSL